LRKPKTGDRPQCGLLQPAISTACHAERKQADATSTVCHNDKKQAVGARTAGDPNHQVAAELWCTLRSPGSAKCLHGKDGPLYRRQRAEPGKGPRE
jgi:hypothetical protein